MNREEAIETLKNYPCVCKYGTSPIKCTDTECDFGKAIRTLVERPKGKWNKFNSYFRKCSLCQKVVGFDYIEQDGEIFNYCPNCGADMR